MAGSGPTAASRAAGTPRSASLRAVTWSIAATIPIRASQTAERGARVPGEGEGEALPPDDRWERALRAEGFARIAGVDEAGRGPLAGPVSAAAVVLDSRDVPDGLDDSKALTAERREALFGEIIARAMAVGIGFAPAAEIDAVNIRRATFAAMARAVRALAVAPDHALVDGRDVPPGLPCPARALVRGDALSVSVAAASIVAKVARDRLMMRLDAAHPEYGFRGHKGYPTAAHRAAILRHGPSPFHRLSFGSVRRAGEADGRRIEPRKHLRDLTIFT